MDVIEIGSEQCPHNWEYHLHGNFQQCKVCARIERYEIRKN